MRFAVDGGCKQVQKAMIGEGKWREPCWSMRPRSRRRAAALGWRLRGLMQGWLLAGRDEKWENTVSMRVAAENEGRCAG